jgi:DNA-damage-inducible protein J
MSTTTINVRIDNQTKQQAQKVFSKLGFDISSAIKVFLKKAIQTSSIPFRVGLMNDPRFISEMKKEVSWAKKHAKRYSTPEELFAEWDKINA